MNTVSVTDLRQDATRILSQVNTTMEPTYVLQNSELKAVILDAQHYASLQEALGDFMDGLDARDALKQPGRITLGEYARLSHSKSPKRSRPVAK